MLLEHQAILEPVDIQVLAAFQEPADLAVKAVTQVFPEAVCPAIPAHQVLLDIREQAAFQDFLESLVILVFLGILEFPVTLALLEIRGSVAIQEYQVIPVSVVGQVNQVFLVILDTAVLWVRQDIQAYLAIQVFPVFLGFPEQVGFLASLDTQDRA